MVSVTIILLLDEFHRPVIVATYNGDVVKGSARSIKGFNITETLGKFDKCLERYGGHELAAGFSAKVDTIDEFVKEFIKYANEEISDDMLVSKLNIDLVLDTDSVDKVLIEDLGKLEPFGYGNPKPVLCLRNVVVFRTA